MSFSLWLPSTASTLESRCLIFYTLITTTLYYDLLLYIPTTILYKDKEN